MECFSRVALHRYEDALVVTEAEPLIAYVASMIARAQRDDGTLEALRRLVEEKIAVHGPIHVTKDLGLFEALSDDRP